MEPDDFFGLFVLFSFLLALFVLFLPFQQPLLFHTVSDCDRYRLASFCCFPPVHHILAVPILSFFLGRGGV